MSDGPLDRTLPPRWPLEDLLIRLAGTRIAKDRSGCLCVVRAPQAHPSLTRGNCGMKILVVEKHPGMRDSLVSQLRAAGMHPAAFGDHHTALLFLLGHLEEIEAVLVNAADPTETARLRRKLEVLGVVVGTVLHPGWTGPARAA